MTQHTPTPKLYAFQNVVTDKENYSFDENGTRYGDTPNIAFQMETPEQAAFIVRAANTFDDFIIACHDALDEIENGGHREKTIQALKNILARAEEKALP